MNSTERKDITSIVNSEIKKYIKDELDNEIHRIMSNSNSQTRKELVTTISNSMESVYKLLWQKKDFWKKDIK